MHSANHVALVINMKRICIDRYVLVHKIINRNSKMNVQTIQGIAQLVANKIAKLHAAQQNKKINSQYILQDDCTERNSF